MKKIYIILVFLFQHLLIDAQVINRTESYLDYPNDNYISMDFFNTNTGHYINDGTTHILYNWNNEGLVDFSIGKNTGLTKFIGESVQTISGNGTTKYYDLFINNTFFNASIQLQKEINIYGISDFTDGIVHELGNGLFVFQNDAGHTNVSDASFVDGKVRKIGDDDFVFPIGDDNGNGIYLYRFAAISAPSDVTDIYDAQYFWKTTDDLHPIASKESIIEMIDDSEYWIIEPINGGSSIDVILSWHPTMVTTNPNTILSDLSKLIIVRWNGNKWINEGGIVDNVNKTIAATPTGYGTFTLGRVYFDSDGDGVTDEQELVDGTDPNDNCSFILSNQIVEPDDIWNNTDCDEDGITNADEKTAGTDPLDPCSNTYISVNEICNYVTSNPNSGLALADCDGGGVNNITECNRGTNPIESLDDPNPNPDNNESFVDILVSGALNTNDRDILPGSTYGIAIADASNPDNTLPLINDDGSYTFETSIPGTYIFQVPLTIANGDIIFVLLTINIIDEDLDTNLPVANTDIGTTFESIPITMPVLSNDRAGNINGILVKSSVDITDIPTNGTAAVNHFTGEITYYPNPGFIGKDTLEYRVKDLGGNQSTALFIIHVWSINSFNTTLASDDYYTTSVNTEVIGNLLINDSDPEGDNLFAVPHDILIPGKGYLEISLNGDFNFTPEPGFIGSVNYPYSMFDDNSNPDTSYASLYILVESAYGKVGDFVWEDYNGDGKQDIGESGIEGVIVDLIPIGSFATTQHTTTNNAGQYIFDNVKDGEYYLKFHLPNKYSFTFANKYNDMYDSDVDGSYGYGTTETFIVSKNEILNYWDAGLYKCAKIGDLTWLDQNMNDVYDLGENGVNGMAVKLYRLEGENKILWNVDYTGLNPNSICGDGYYSFCTNPGTYYLQFVVPENGLVPSRPNIGDNDEIDSDITRAYGKGTTEKFTLFSGDGNDLSIDAGFYNMSEVTNSLAWIDDNSNGIKDNSESTIPNMFVEIFDINGELYNSMFTDIDGKFYFDYLQAEDYYIKFNIPSGLSEYNFTLSNQGDEDKDSDVTGAFGIGTTNLFELQPDEEKQHLDAGISQGSLPLNTLFIGAEWRKDHVLVKWVTSNEINVDEFVVQRLSSNGSKFINLGVKRSKGELTNEYSFEDRDEFVNGIYYYRILTKDLDGSNSVSKIVTVFISSKDNWCNLRVFPNPAVNNTYIKFDLDVDVDLKVDVFTPTGKKVLGNVISEYFKKGIYKKLINIETLPAGIYYIKLDDSNKVMFKRFVKIGL